MNKVIKPAVKSHVIVNRLRGGRTFDYCIDCDKELSRFGPDRDQPCTGAPAHYYRCNNYDGSFGWAAQIAHSPEEAAQRYYAALAPDYKDCTFVYVLEPGQNYGVDQPHQIKIKK